LHTSFGSGDSYGFSGGSESATFGITGANRIKQIQATALCRAVGGLHGIRNASFQFAMNATNTSSTLLKTKVETRTAKIGIIGMGYVGLPLALLFSEQKFRVTGFDIDPAKVETLSRGGSYIVRIPETEIQAAIANGFQASRTWMWS
jgi:hypothetical protein